MVIDLAPQIGRRAVTVSATEEIPGRRKSQAVRRHPNRDHLNAMIRVRTLSARVVTVETAPAKLPQLMASAPTWRAGWQSLAAMRLVACTFGPMHRSKCPATAKVGDSDR